MANRKTAKKKQKQQAKKNANLLENWYKGQQESRIKLTLDK